MPTQTQTKFDPSSKLNELEAKAAAAEQHRDELERDYTEKRVALEGPDLNTPGLLDELRDLRLRDPEQFKPDGTPVGENAKKLATAIDEVGELGPLVEEVEHARLLADRARLDVGSFIAVHIDAIFAARQPEAEQRRATVLANRDRLIASIDDYQDFGVWVMGMLAAAHRENYVPGLEQALHFRKSLAGDLLPELIEESEGER